MEVADIKISKNVGKWIFYTFLSVPVLTSIISTFHTYHLFALGNHWVAAFGTSLTYELCNIAALGVMVFYKDKVSGWFIWPLFIMVVLIQIIGNVYYSLNVINGRLADDIGIIASFQELVQFVGMDGSNSKYIVSFLVGIPIPVMSAILSHVAAVFFAKVTEEASKSVHDAAIVAKDEEIEKLISEHEQKIRDLKADHERHIEKINEDHEHDIERLIAKYESKFQTSNSLLVDYESRLLDIAGDVDHERQKDARLDTVDSEAPIDREPLENATGATGEVLVAIENSNTPPVSAGHEPKIDIGSINKFLSGVYGTNSYLGRPPDTS